MRHLYLLATLALGCAGPGPAVDDTASGGTGTKADWPAGATCGADLAGLIGKAATDLYYLSESDRPLTPVRWTADEVAGGGVDAPTLRRLVRVPGDAEVEERAFIDWMDSVDLALWTQGTEARLVPERRDALRDLMDAELVDERVFRYAVPSDPASVQVYVVGRDGCGGIVGFFTEAVET